MNIEDEDDEDFNDTISSKLANLFDSDIMPQNVDNRRSLMYTPTKLPKKFVINNTNKNETTIKTMTIIYASAVNAFKFENGKYNVCGKLGSALVGSHDNSNFKLILYTGKQQQITNAIINQSFQFICQPNNYCNFYDDNRQNWCLMFDNEQIQSTFCQYLTICKLNCLELSGNTEIIIQDLSIINENNESINESNNNNIIEVNYKGFIITETFNCGNLFIETQKPLRIKLTDKWLQIFNGLKVGSKRYVIIPFKLKDNFPELTKTGLKSSFDDILRFSYEFELIQIIQNVKIREKSVIKNAETNPIINEEVIATKSNLISRMSQMGGLPIIPLIKHETIKTDIINSDERTNNATIKPLPKPRNNSHIIQSENNNIPNTNEDTKMLSLNSAQIIDTNLSSLIFNELRTNNSEVRITLNKIIDKIDSFDHKLSDIKSNSNSCSNFSINNIGMDSAILLSSIQRIIHENSNMKQELEDKSFNLQTLNEKVCDLLKQQQNNFNETQMKDIFEKYEFQMKLNQELLFENNLLKKQITEIKDENYELKNRLTIDSNQLQSKEFNKIMKKTMNDVYHTFLSKLDENQKSNYETQEIINLVTSSIKGVTISVINSKTPITGNHFNSNNSNDSNIKPLIQERKYEEISENKLKNKTNNSEEIEKKLSENLNPELVSTNYTPNYNINDNENNVI